MRSIRCLGYVLVCWAVGSSTTGDADGCRRLATVRGAPVLPPIIIIDCQPDDVHNQTAMSLVSRTAAHAYATGTGVNVAVLDGGFDLRHEFLSGRLGSQWDAVDQDGTAQDLGNGVDDDSDTYTDWAVGHGTFAAGLIISCAPSATINPIRVLDDEGNGTPAALARGIDKAVEFGAEVINLSLVATTMTTQLENSIQAAVNAGAILVCAAGNEPNGPFSAQYLRERSIVVGAVNNTPLVASFSPNQSLVDVFGPGVQVKGPLGGATLDSYAYWDGTSFSCAFVSAAAALVEEDVPGLSLSSMRTRLGTSIDTVADANPSSRGSIDLLYAVD